MKIKFAAATLAALLASAGTTEAHAQDVAALKAEAVRGVDARAKMAQVLNDQIFSFGEPGFEEVETSKLITTTLEKNGFSVRRGISGMPTGWVATWTNKVKGKPAGPTIAFGSDIDGVPRTSQKPGIPWHDPLVEGAPGHGEGHNSGNPLNIVAALTVKDIMVKHGIPGTLMLWPGVAEELVAAKAYMVRDGVFKDVDAVLFTHVDDNLAVSWGPTSGTGLVSVEYNFQGENAHSAGSPWRGKSALDAVTLMNLGWEFRREHLRPEQRSHYVIKKGGDQPNVVPADASVWYYFREQSFDAIAKNFEIGNKIADAAAMMTDTTVTRRILGTAAPRHFNKPIAEAAYANIQQVGLPKWSDDEQAFAKAVQTNLKVKKVEGLSTELDKLEPPVEEPKSGGSDDIGDVSWVVPTVTLRYPANIPDVTYHHWSAAIAMATPIAHKGVVAGAKVIAMTTLDMLTNPQLLTDAKSYFTDVQTKEQKYLPMIGPKDQPPVTINADMMSGYRSDMRKLYYDPAKYPTYLDQLGIKFPTLTK